MDAFEKLYIKMANDLEAFNNKYKDVPSSLRSVGEAIILPFNQKKIDAWNDHADHFLKEFLEIRNHNKKEYDDLIKRTNVGNDATIRVAGDKLITAFKKFHADALNASVIASGLAEVVDMEKINPDISGQGVDLSLFNKILAISLLAPNDYLRSDFKFEHVNRFGIPYDVRYLFD